MKKGIRNVTLGLALGGAFLLGRFSQDFVFAGPPPTSPYKKLNLFGKVLAYVENNYVEEVTEEQLIYGSIKGMLSSLDPHTAFLTPDLYKEMRNDASGEFGGVGVEVNIEEDGEVVIISVLEGTPAYNAGIKSGDILESIDGQSAKGLDSTEIVRALRGKKGTQVALLIRREGSAEPRSFTVTRDQIKIIPVSFEALSGGLGYIKIKQFQDRTSKMVEEALQKLEGQPGGLKGLVLDLRDNPGGLVEQAISVADAFLSEGVIVSTEGKNAKSVETFYAHPKKTHEGFPIVVLVNAGTASASEIVAGALQDHKRAAILGTPTFGKGSVQSIIEFEDGSALKLTIARYFTPLHRSIQERGISPDVLVEEQAPNPKKISREADLPRHLKNTSSSQSTEKSEDYVLSRAVEYLKSWQTLSDGSQKRPRENINKGSTTVSPD